MIYIDPTTDEWVAEYETRSSEGEVTRRTEWFRNRSDAERFTRTGVIEAPVLKGQNHGHWPR